MRRRGFFSSPKAATGTPNDASGLWADDFVAETSDTAAALAYLRQRFPGCVILKHFLYAVIDDRSQVERELNALQMSHAIRLLSCVSSHEIAVVQTSELLSQIGTWQEHSISRLVKERPVY